MGRQYFEDFVTNESLDAIVTGLNLSSKDIVLSICGSGDQAFAILERARQVTAIDSKKAQVEYALTRKRKLEESDFSGFIAAPIEPTDQEDEECLKHRVDYFSSQRLKKIAKKVKGAEVLKFEIGNIYAIELGNQRFDRIYLSNSVGYGSYQLNFAQTDKRLRSIVPALNPEGLIYVTDGMQAIARSRREGNSRVLSHLGLKINELLTIKAQRLQSKARARNYANEWLPVVLQKVENN